MRIVRFSIYKLFGLFDHSVPLNQSERVTIIHGPNGYGKTTLLRLIDSLCKGSLREVARTPFQRFILDFDDGRRLEIERYINALATPSCRLRLMAGEHILAAAETPLEGVGPREVSQIQRTLPFMRQIGEDLWEDTTDGEILTSETLLSRYAISSMKTDRIDWFVNLMGAINVKMIETSRLNREIARDPRRRVQHSDRDATAAVQRYSSELSSKIKATLADYAERAQRLDQSFPIRLLELNRFPSISVSATRLSERINQLEEKRSRLKDAGLLEQDEKQARIPTNIDDSVQGVLSMYIEDVEEKLKSFDDILAKIELLLQILGAHFSFKRVEASRESGFSIYTHEGEPLDVSRLSSGEQHLIVLVYELLFTDKPDSLILIDEPEISLHIEWQLSFLHDLQQIARVASHEIVIATHSPQIVNDRLDLLVPFNAPRASK